MSIFIIAKLNVTIGDAFLKSHDKLLYTTKGGTQMQHIHTEEHKQLLRENGKYGHLGGRPSTKGYRHKTLRKPYENPMKNKSENLSDLLRRQIFNLAFTENPDMRALKLLYKMQHEETEKYEKLLEKRMDQLVKFNLRGKDGPKWLLNEIDNLEDLLDDITRDDDESDCDKIHESGAQQNGCQHTESLVSGGQEVGNSLVGDGLCDGGGEFESKSENDNLEQWTKDNGDEEEHPTQTNGILDQDT